MKFIKYFPKQLLALSVVLFGSSCSLFDLDNTDPNSPSAAAPDLLLAQIESNIANEFADQETTVETFMGLVGTQKTSRYELNDASFNDFWFDMYTGPIKDLDNLIAATGTNPGYLGIAQILKAYTFSTMVDLFGDVPFSQAGKADAATPNKTPAFDKDSDIYAECIKLIDAGIANVGKNAVTINGDIIYNGSPAKWAALGRTLKLRMLISGRLGITDANKKIQDAIKAGGFITSADDFQFQFSKNPVSILHPWYTGAYSGGEFDGSYINNQLITDMLVDKDPRFPFYFKRQTVKILNPNDPTEKGTINPGYIPLRDVAYWESILGKPKADFKKADTLFVAGLVGRERGDATGIPADGSLRILPGVYPCGGFYDVAITAAAIPAANKAPSGGIFPMITSVNSLYYQIEGILIAGAAGDAKKLFEQAVKDHISKVVNFGSATDAVNVVRPSAAAVDAYVAKWVARYDAAPDNNAKLDVAMKQAWYSSFGGGGFDLFNSFRRTGYPSTLQEPLTKTSRNFPLRYPYPQNEISLNPSAKAYESVVYDKTPIFWDK